MDFFTLLLTGIGLSMDAFAMSVCAGIVAPHGELKKRAGLMASAFGLAQGLMPFLGYLAGMAVSQYISTFDHFIAFGLLAFIGIKMIVEALKKNDEACIDTSLSLATVLLLAVATSIDALAVGISFAAIRVDILLAASVIAIVTFIFCFFGVIMGKRLGNRFEQRAEIFGGIVLCLIGIKILLEHLGLIVF